ncbi:MAG: plasmid recombination enzyme [Proteobacteria bacterium]|nr:MAG: plasmid recombination enzyme [Pseudomonadota bacterium]
MAYAIMRAKKLATAGGVAASLKHHFRERPTPNADADRTPENTQHGPASSTSQAMGQLRELLPEKRRKDAVLAVEYLMTASPEWWKSASQVHQDEFFARSLTWLKDKYGAQNVFVATVHRDEKSPHLAAFVVPMTVDGRLSAKEFIGNRDKMRSDQTSFAEAVRDLGLERGIEGSKARHQRIQQHYGQLERPPVTLPRLNPDHLKPKVLQKGLFRSTVEGPDLVAERVAKLFDRHYQPAVEQASVTVQETRRAREMAQTARALKEQEKTAQKAYADVQKKLRSLMEIVRAGGPALEVIRDRLIENHKARQVKTKRDQGVSR